MSVGGEVVAEVAEGVFDLAEPLVVGQIDECISHAFEQFVGAVAQCLADLLTTHDTVLCDRKSGRSSWVQHRNLPGVRAIVVRSTGSNFTP